MDSLNTILVGLISSLFETLPPRQINTSIIYKLKRLKTQSRFTC